ncbi:hypothetical protein vBBceHLY2_00091 [Bacillus phage vB_BceH_LY2]|nr:hypothetical protein vBBceHLY2_00091 [Bacillus phage vB_BceH_LY2]
MDKPHIKPPLNVNIPVVMKLDVFDPVLFSVGTPVAMMTYTSDLEKMYWRTEYGLVSEYHNRNLRVIKVPYSDGNIETSTVHINHLDGKFYIVPLDRLIKDLQEEKDEK